MFLHCLNIEQYIYLLIYSSAAFSLSLFLFFNTFYCLIVLYLCLNINNVIVQQHKTTTISTKYPMQFMFWICSIYVVDIRSIIPCRRSFFAFETYNNHRSLSVYVQEISTSKRMHIQYIFIYICIYVCVWWHEFSVCGFCLLWFLGKYSQQHKIQTGKPKRGSRSRIDSKMKLCAVSVAVVVVVLPCNECGTWMQYCRHFVWMLPSRQ